MNAILYSPDPIPGDSGYTLDGSANPSQSTHTLHLTGNLENACLWTVEGKGSTLRNPIKHGEHMHVHRPEARI